MIARTRRAGLQVRSGRRPQVLVAAVLLVICVAAAVTVTVNSVGRKRAQVKGLPPGAWSLRLLVGGPTQVDSQGQRWTVGVQPVGGTSVANSVTPTNTASPRLYGNARVGVRSWTVRVPRLGRYAVDLLEYVDMPSETGRFRVTVSSAGHSHVLSRSFTTVDDRQVAHLIGSVNLSPGWATFHFIPLSGRTAVSGLSLSSYGAAETPRTLLDEKFITAQDRKLFGADWKAVSATNPAMGGGTYTYITSPTTEGINDAGDLYLKARATQKGSFVSGEISSEGHISFGYGEVSALLRLPSREGMWPAFWAVGTDQKEGWPGCGEIDIVEVYNSDPDQVTEHLHTKPIGGQSPSAYDVSIGNTVTLPQPPSERFQWYQLIYQPGVVAFAVDGTVRTVFAREDMASNFDWVFGGQRFFLLFDVAVTNLAAPHSSGSSQMLVKQVKITS